MYLCVCLFSKVIISTQNLTLEKKKFNLIGHLFILFNYFIIFSFHSVFLELSKPFSWSCAPNIYILDMNLQFYNINKRVMPSQWWCRCSGCCSASCVPSQWRHNGCNSVSNHQPRDCLLKRLFRRRSKKTSTLRVTGLCVGNSPGTGEFPAPMASNAENVSIWWRHHALQMCDYSNMPIDSMVRRYEYTHCNVASCCNPNYSVLTTSRYLAIAKQKYGYWRKIISNKKHRIHWQ